MSQKNMMLLLAGLALYYFYQKQTVQQCYPLSFTGPLPPGGVYCPPTS